MTGPGGKAPRRLARAIAALGARVWLLWMVLAAVFVFSITGATRIGFDDELLRFFKSDIPAYTHYADVMADFETDANDLILLVQAEDVADPKVLTALSDFLLEAQFFDGVRTAVSPLALRIKEGGMEVPLVPFPPPAREEMGARLDGARANLPALGQLMSEDRSAMIAVLPMRFFAPEERGERIAELDALEGLAAAAEAASGARFRLSGYVVIRDSVARALTRDLVVVNGLGMLVAFTIAVIALRSVVLGLLTMPGMVMALLTTLGLLGHLGVSVNTVTVTLPMLVIVLAASDSIHISHERGRQAGRDPTRATLRTVRRIAVACIFAAVTTAVAFGALAASQTIVIAEMGAMGALSIMVSVVIVLLTQTLVMLTAGRFAWFNPLFVNAHARTATGFGFIRLPRLALRHPRVITTLALVTLLGTAWLYAQAGPRYSMLDSLHDDSPVLAVFREIEERVMPVSLLQVPVESGDPAKIGAVHDALARWSGSDRVQSIAPLAEAGVGARELPDALARRVLSEDGTRALVNLPFHYESGDTTIALADEIDKALAEDPSLAGIEVGATTGLPVMSARIAGGVLNEINRSLLIAVAAVAFLIWAWLGSLRIALVSLLPNMLPITVIGAWITLAGRGIEFSNGLALTVAFGIAVDDTLHVLNRLRLSGGLRRIEKARLLRAVEDVTPALVTTSMVLFFGTAGAYFADNKSVYDFGKIAMAVYALALVADLMILPAALAVFGPKSYLKRRKEPQ